MTTTTNTRSEIMDAFGAQLAAGGYQGISLTGVARTVGIQKPSIYHHFPGGKEALYEAVAIRFISELHERIDRSLSEAHGFEDALRRLGATAIDEAKRSITFEQRIYDALDHVTEATNTAVSTRYVDDILNPVVRVFEQAVASGEIAGDPWFLMNAFLHLARATEPGDTPDPVAPVVALFLDGARPR